MALASRSAERLSALIQYIYGRNPFYTSKLDAAGIDPSSLRFPGDLSKLPLTTKRELIADQQASPPWGTNLSEPLDTYTRYNQTSSTTGSPLRWLDTNDSWQWMLECWKAVYAGAKVDARDRILFPFSFGPFLGFWTAFEAGCQIGAHCIPAGGMSSQARLSMIDDAAADRHLLHADLRAPTARGCRRDARRKGESVRELGARADRGGRSGRKHPVDAPSGSRRAGERASSIITASPKSVRSASSAGRLPARCI